MDETLDEEVEEFVKQQDGTLVPKKSVLSVESKVSDDDMEKAWREQIEQSAVWKEHMKQHADAEIVAVKEAKIEKGEGVFLGYTHNKVYPIATCVCGHDFAASESGQVYEIKGNLYKQGEVYDQKSDSYSQVGPVVEYKK